MGQALASSWRSEVPDLSTDGKQPHVSEKQILGAMK